MIDVQQATASHTFADICTAPHKGDMEAVFILHHMRSDDEHGDDAKLIGVYRTERDAKAASSRLSYLPGFVDHPNSWRTTLYAVNKDHWTGGFVTVPSNGS